MSRFASVFLLLAGCAYISQPYVDPADPLVIEIANAGSETVFLPLKDGGLLDGALMIVTKGERAAVQAKLSCADVSCAAGCDVAPCQLVRAVRELAPGEGVLVEWNAIRYDEGDLSCGGVSTTCRVGSRAANGRYLGTVCFGRALEPATLAAMQRSADDAKIVLNAAIVGEECAPAVDFALPSRDVRYKVEVR